MMLNEALAKKQMVTKEQRIELFRLYQKLDALLQEEANDPNPGKEYAERMREIEFELQKNWNFEQDANFHSYEFLFSSCTCPKMDNEERFGFPKIYNCSCPIHGYNCEEKTKEEEHVSKIEDRMKTYEKQFESIVPSHEHIIVRIDGHKFSKFTKGFKKPFDWVFLEAMDATMLDLVEKFQAYVGYTQSDEITLLLPSLILTEEKETHQHIFNGRVQKIASLVSAYTTMRFNTHFSYNIATMKEQIMGDPYQGDMELYFQYLKKEGEAWFDARVFGVPSNEEAFNVFLWRNRDCVRNSKAMFAQAYCSHKELKNKNVEDQIGYCKYKTGADWHDIPSRYKFGLFVKKTQYIKEAKEVPEFSSNLCKELVVRSKLETWSEKLEYSYEKVELFCSKYMYEIKL